MSSKLIKRKLPYADDFTDIKDAYNYLVKEINGTFTKKETTAVEDSNQQDSTGLPIGSVIESMLTESQFQGQAGSGWVLMDGRSVADTAYSSLTGFTNIPDARGRFLRGKSHGSGNNPDGNLSLGSYTGDKLVSHDHELIANTTASLSLTGSTTAYWLPQSGGSTQNFSIQNTGSNETAPKSITVNIFIRIN